MPLSNLNKEQSKQQLVIWIQSCNCICWDGQNSTIVGRIAHLLNNNIEPNRLLLLTFTNKAANEMVARVAKYFTKEIAKQIVAGTFHSVSYRLLKELNENCV